MQQIKHTFRLIAFALAAALLVSSIAGCRKNNKAITEPTASESATEQPTETSAPTDMSQPGPINTGFEPKFG
jgi:hypothetical protein